MKINYLEFFNELGLSAGDKNAYGVYNDYQLYVWINPNENISSLNMKITFPCHIKKKNNELENVIRTNLPLNAEIATYSTGVDIFIKEYLLDAILCDLKLMFDIATEALKQYNIPTVEYCPNCGKKIEHFDPISPEMLANINYQTAFVNFCNVCDTKTKIAENKSFRFKTYLICILASFGVSLLAFMLSITQMNQFVYEKLSLYVNIFAWLLLCSNTIVFCKIFLKRKNFYDISALIVNYSTAIFFVVLYVLFGNVLIYGSLANSYGWNFSNYFEAFGYLIQNIEDVRSRIFSILLVYLVSYIVSFFILLRRIMKFNKKLKQYR